MQITFGKNFFVKLFWRKECLANLFFIKDFWISFADSSEGKGSFETIRENRKTKNL